MNITTKTLDGAEVCVAIGGQNTEIRNDGAATVYASANEGIVAGADGVVAIPAGAAVTVLDTRGRVYLLGTGEVSVVGKDTVSAVFKCAPASGGSGQDDVARQAIAAHEGNAVVHVTTAEKANWNAVNYSNPNLLINPDFRVNQRGASGTISAAGYFVDRWQLTGGEVTINADCTIMLNGTIAQTLEFAVDADVTATANAGTATYDDTTRTFTLTANGEVVEWAKLEIGNVATPFSPPDPATELSKCQRYYQKIAAFLPVRAAGIAANTIDFTFPISGIMRVLPTADLSALTVCGLDYAVQSGFDFAINIVSNGCVSIRVTKTAHGMTDAIARPTAALELIAEL